MKSFATRGRPGGYLRGGGGGVVVEERMDLQCSLPLHGTLVVVMPQSVLQVAVAVDKAVIHKLLS